MEWKKAPEELVQFLAEKMRPVNCEYSKMFGYPAYFINGNMFAGIHGETLFLRLSDADVKKIIETHKGVALFEPMPGRPMRGYVAVSKPFYSDGSLFEEWLEKSVRYVSSLPPKKK